MTNPYTYGGNKEIKVQMHGKNAGITTMTFFGQCLHENPVPQETADWENSPFVIIQDPDTGARIGINKDMLSLGVLALAAPGGGKTNLFNIILKGILKEMQDQDVVVIFDTKGDYLREFGNKIAEQDRIIVGTGSIYKNSTSYHNIFAEIMPRGKDGRLMYTLDCDVNAMEISEQLFSEMQSDTQPVFPEMAQQIVAGIIVYFMRLFVNTDQTKLNNRELIRFIQRATAAKLKNMFEQEFMADYSNCISFISGSGNMAHGVMAYIGSTMRKMFIDSFAEADATREFAMQDVIKGDRKKVVFIEYDLVRGKALAPMYGIVIDQALKYALGGREEQRKNVYFLLDECKLLPKINLDTALSFGRSQNVRILAGFQNIKAVEKIYGEAGGRDLLAGFQNIFAFKIADHDTRKFLIERSGENYQNISFSAQYDSANIQKNGHTIEEWDIQSLRLGDAIILMEGKKPFLFKMPKYESGI